MGLMSDLGDWFRGKGQTQYDYPSLPGVSYKGRPVNMAMSLGFGDEENAWIFDKVTGGKVPVQNDQDGRPYITVDQGSGLQSGGAPLAAGSYYLDRPGLDTQTWKVIGANVGLLASTGGTATAARAIGARALPRVAARVPGLAKSLAGTMGAFGAWEAERQAALSAAAQQNLMDPGEITDQALWGLPFGVVGPAGRAVKRGLGVRPLVRPRTPMRTKR